MFRKLTFAVSTGWAACLAMGGCVATGADEAGETGEATLAIQEVPEDVGCVAITAIGSHRLERSFDVVAGGPAVLTLQGLAVGDVTFRAEAFDGACGTVAADSIPTWLSDDKVAQIESGEVADVVLTMRRSAKADVSLDFVDADCASDGAACETAESCCSASCVDGTCGGVTCDDAATTIDAGAYPDNTLLDEAFAHLGVHLALSSTSIGGSVTNSTPAWSPTLFIQRFQEGSLDGTWTNDPHFDRILRIEFDEPTDSVAIDAFDAGSTPTPSRGIMEAYDTAGRLVASVDVPLTMQSPDGLTLTPHTLSVSRAEKDIAWVLAYGSGSHYTSGATLANLQYDRSICGP